MSQRYRSAPGNHQGRHGGGKASRFKSAITTKRIGEGKRAAIHEVGDARRADVYRTDVEFAPDDIAPRSLPPRGSAERNALLAEVKRLREQGLSHLKIANSLEPPWSASTVSNLLREIGEK